MQSSSSGADQPRFMPRAVEAGATYAFEVARRRAGALRLPPAAHFVAAGGLGRKPHGLPQPCLVRKLNPIRAVPGQIATAKSFS